MDRGVSTLCIIDEGKLQNVHFAALTLSTYSGVTSRR